VKHFLRFFFLNVLPSRSILPIFLSFRLFFTLASRRFFILFNILLSSTFPIPFIFYYSVSETFTLFYCSLLSVIVSHFFVLFPVLIASLAYFFIIYSIHHSSCYSRLHYLPVFGIRIRRIRIFLGLPDQHSDPLVTSTNPAPAPDPSISHKSVELTEVIDCKIKFYYKYFPAKYLFLIIKHIFTISKLLSFIY
jgi:hypothetical protein